ncbi:MAG: DUF1573 domain-containing protein [Thermodesulfobacteriota bacterium]
MSRPLAIFTALAAICLLALASPAAALKGPHIVFDRQELVVSQVVEGKTLVAKFTFTNKGDQNLIIDKVVPSCGCAASKYDRVTKPGQKGVVTLEIDTTDLSGAFRKTAAVATNDPNSPVVTLAVMGETLGRIVVDKGRRIDMVGCVGQPVTTTATLSDPRGRGLVITGVQNSMSDQLRVSLDPQPGGKSYKLHLSAKSKEPIEYAGPLVLSMPGGGPVSIWVQVNVQGPFSVRPHEVHFGTLTKGLASRAARSVVVKRACSPELKVSAVDYDHNLFTVEQSWKTPGQELWLVITPRTENLPEGPFEKALGIQTGGKVFTVRLAGRVR